MRRALILAQSDEARRALRASWALFDPLATPGSDQESGGLGKEDQIVVRDAEALTPVGLYQTLEPRLRVWADGLQDAERGVVLVDHVSVAHANPLSGGGWSGAVSMLVLAFPDLHWCFGVVTGRAREIAQSDEANTVVVRAFDEHGLMSLAQVDREPLFDPSGLANWLRGLVAAAEDKGNKVAPYVPLRRQMAVAIDDERTYAYLHAYAAYRWGFRSLPVTTDTLARAVFGRYVETDCVLVFEDLYLNFADADRKHYSDLGGDRHEHLGALERVPYRVFVTTGQRHGGDEKKRDSNRRYMDEQRAGRAVKWLTLIHKPVGGLFDLWQRGGLASRRLGSSDKRGVGDGFVWPPAHPSGDADTGHSAPGRLLLVAETLIRRAHALRDRALHSVPDAVRGAVMATNALELLGDRTPTTSVEALSLKHQFEVIAECQFSGVEYHIVIEPRMAEIRREIRALSRWFHPRKQWEAATNGEMTILNSLVGILRGDNQFDEEELCMQRVRRLHNDLWARQSVWRRPLWPLLRYSEWLFSSAWAFFGAIVVWVSGLTCALWLLHPGESWAEAFAKMFGGFTSASVEVGGVPVMLVGTLAVIAGLGHLGVFISRLYSQVTRK